MDAKLLAESAKKITTPGMTFADFKAAMRKEMGDGFASGSPAVLKTYREMKATAKEPEVIKAKFEEKPQKALKDLKVLFYDYGLFMSLAQRMARDVKKVWYACPYRSAFSTSDKGYLGDGFDDIERVHDFWGFVKKPELRPDLVVFPDYQDSDMQKVVREMGIPVFGSGDGEDLEINRVDFMKLLKEIGLPAAKYELVRGMDEIRKYLMNPKNKDKWIKGNIWRGDFETYHHLSWAHTAPWLGEVAHKVGSHGEDTDMLMFDPIDPAVEIGIDAYVIDDKIPPVNIIGYEVKGNGNVSKMVDKLPDCITVVTDKFLPKLKDRSYFGPFSAEIRVRKGESWFIDPCMREPNPPGCGRGEAYENYSEMIWDIANGRIPKPKPAAKYMVEINLYTSIDDRQVCVEWPKEIDRWVKLKYCTKIGDVVYNDPKCGAGALGSVVALGDDLEKTVKECLKRADMVVANGIEYDEGFLEHVHEVVEKGRKEGIDF